MKKVPEKSHFQQAVDNSSNANEGYHNPIFLAQQLKKENFSLVFDIASKYNGVYLSHALYRRANLVKSHGVSYDSLWGGI